MRLYYTGKGDGGKSIVGKKKIDKTCIEIEALGDLDELNSLIGLVKSVSSSQVWKILNSVQENLFIIQANVANFMFPKNASGKPMYKAPEFKPEKIAELEELIDKMEAKIKPARGFIISGENTPSAWLDFLRAVSRRVERSVLKFSKRNKIQPEIFAYLNRLSSLFFAMARMESHSSGRKEKHPQYK